MSTTETRLDVPRWLPPVAIGLVLAGLAVSGYLTYEHFTASTTLACPNTGTLNCAKVTSSQQSKLFGIPVAVLGLGYFIAVLAPVLPVAWRSADSRLRMGRLVAAGVGVCFVLYLIYAELFLVNAICVWCTVVHILTFVLFGVIAFGTAVTAR
jgi:uncharacterized membrane protein